MNPSKPAEASPIHIPKRGKDKESSTQPSTNRASRGRAASRGGRGGGRGKGGRGGKTATRIDIEIDSSEDEDKKEEDDDYEDFGGGDNDIGGDDEFAGGNQAKIPSTRATNYNKIKSRS